MTEIVDEIVSDLERFLHCAKDRSWSEDPDNRKGMRYDVGHFFGGEWDFEWLDDRAEDLVDMFELRWRGKGTSLTDVIQDFYRVYTHIWESEQFIRVVIEPEAIVFNIVAGNTEDLAHGHFLQFRVVGKRIVQLIQKYNNIRESWSGELGKR